MGVPSASTARRGQTWEPLTENYEERIAEVFSRQGAMALIGASLARVEPGFTELHLPCRDEVGQHHGMVHGGVVAMLADTAAALAALSVAAEGAIGMTVEFKINLLAPATGDKLIARGHLIRSGRPLSVAAADIYAASGDDEFLVATALGTFAGR
jgi:uncharacterized protein (TIGR00369 family)